MSVVISSVTGGEKLRAHLNRLAANLASAKSVSVGFLEGATYPSDGGARLESRAESMTEDQKLANPDWYPRLKAWAAWQAKHQPVIGIAQVAFWMEFGTKTSPPRPFFRGTISKHRGEWGGNLANLLKASDFNARVSLGQLGVLVSEQIRTSIVSWPTDNKPLTVFIKGFSHGLVDHGLMQRHVDSVVT